MSIAKSPNTSILVNTSQSLRLAADGGVTLLAQRKAELTKKLADGRTAHIASDVRSGTRFVPTSSGVDPFGGLKDDRKTYGQLPSASLRKQQQALANILPYLQMLGASKEQVDKLLDNLTGASGQSLRRNVSLQHDHADPTRQDIVFVGEDENGYKHFIVPELNHQKAGVTSTMERATVYGGYNGFADTRDRVSIGGDGRQ
jgi:hypothetical protein